MAAAEFLLDRFAAADDKTAFFEAEGGSTSYATLLTRIAALEQRLRDEAVPRGASVQLCGDFGTEAAAWLLTLWRHGAIVAPVAPSSREKLEEFARVADAGWRVEAATGQLQRLAGGSAHGLFDRLRADEAPGLVIFSSGTTGASKAALHDVRRLLTKFHRPGKDFVTLGFLLFDHIAGIDTLLYSLANGSTLVCLPDRSVGSVLARMAEHRVEVLPTAPSFLNMLLLSRGGEGFALPDLKIITYGAEMMPQGLLERVADAFPGVQLIQKYGASELGALRSRSEGARSRWIRLEGDGAAWRVADGLLEIRTTTAMVGYLNAPSPFTEDGWYRTGDRVEVQGDQLRFLGRDSDMINVGGQKVFPAEVENALMQIPGVVEASVYGAPHPLLGAAVCARIRMADPEARPAEIRSAIRTGLAGVVEPYKIPQKIELATGPLATARFKQHRG
ncbi:long-chain fatty acid--CoA ligase [Cereibacter changlensis]|uniref:Long-chain fatty acid--CoA ligase n=1 Tax=Cereibacter changlensis TaxID=402884 RepID=A0A4U0YWK2_9RHOB|nr:fatty acid--CoA ligase family protein [Cereibacter changlensis]TKA97170.1 long-chain fatty acid--CoA ligase [Cereibacter changlensis]